MRGKNDKNGGSRSKRGGETNREKGGDQRMVKGLIHGLDEHGKCLFFNCNFYLSIKYYWTGIILIFI